MPQSDVTPKKRAVDVASAFLASSPLPPTKKQQLLWRNIVTNSRETISVSDIVERTRRIFRQHEEGLDVIQLPCLSARLFACYTLVAQQQQQRTPLCSTRFEQAVRHIRPLLSFLSALVRVELMSLRQDETTTNSRNDLIYNNHEQQTQQQQQPPRQRRVQFSGFDCSSTQPPSDARLGSHLHRQRCTDALIDAMEQANAIQVILACNLGTPSRLTPTTQQHVATTTGSNMTCCDADRLPVMDCLQSMISFFQDLAQGSPLVATCAQSVHSSYPAARVGKAIHLYRNEFSTLLQIQSTLMLSSPSLSPTPHVLFLQHTLVTFLGQDIRFQLRTLFNPPPYNAMDKPDHHNCNHYNSKRTRVPNLIQLFSSERPPTGKKYHEDALDDSMISCIVSTALQRIYDYLGRDVSLHLDQYYQVAQNSPLNPTSSPAVTTTTTKTTLILPPPLRKPRNFCQSAASQRGLVEARECHHKVKSKNNNKVHPTSTTFTSYQDEELQTILQDIKQAFLFLSAARAARFLLDLLKADGVDQAIRSVGGWSTIERNAQLLCQYQSYFCPEDQHLVLLARIPVLIQCLESLVDDGEDDNNNSNDEEQTTVGRCQQALQDMFLRFKCGEKGRLRKRKRFPQIDIIANAFEEMTALCQFPVVKSTITDTADDDNSNTSTTSATAT